MMKAASDSKGMSIKSEAIIYVLIVCLTLLTPCVGYYAISENTKSLAEEALKNGRKFDDLSQSIKEGKTQINKENVSATMHLLAESQKTLADTFLSFDTVTKNVLNGIIGTAVFQFLLLMFILHKRRKDRNSQ
jgi:predicted PurR-regulated permease PerM